MNSGEYTGIDNLEVMSVAKNYNSNIVNMVKQFLMHEEKVIDFGCGDGTLSKLMIERGLDVIGVETSPTLISICQKKKIKTFKKIDDIDFEWSQLCMINVLEHIEFDNQLLTEIHSRMGANGRLFVYVPAHRFLFSEMDIHVRHFRRYTKKELVRKIEESGFQIISAGYVDSIGFFAQLFLKFLHGFRIGKGSSGRISQRQVYFYDRLIFPLSKLLDKYFRGSFGKNIYVSALKSQQ